MNAVMTRGLVTCVILKDNKSGVAWIAILITRMVNVCAQIISERKGKCDRDVVFNHDNETMKNTIIKIIFQIKTIKLQFHFLRNYNF